MWAKFGLVTGSDGAAKRPPRIALLTHVVVRIHTRSTDGGDGCRSAERRFEVENRGLELPDIRRLTGCETVGRFHNLWKSYPVMMQHILLSYGKELYTLCPYFVLYYDRIL